MKQRIFRTEPLYRIRFIGDLQNSQRYPTFAIKAAGLLWREVEIVCFSKLKPPPENSLLKFVRVYIKRIYLLVSKENARNY